MVKFRLKKTKTGDDGTNGSNSTGSKSSAQAENILEELRLLKNRVDQLETTLTDLKYSVTEHISCPLSTCVQRSDGMASSSAHEVLSGHQEYNVSNLQPPSNHLSSCSCMQRSTDKTEKTDKSANDDLVHQIIKEEQCFHCNLQVTNVDNVKDSSFKEISKGNGLSASVPYLSKLSNINSSISPLLATAKTSGRRASECDTVGTYGSSVFTDSLHKTFSRSSQFTCSAASLDRSSNKNFMYDKNLSPSVCTRLSMNKESSSTFSYKGGWDLNLNSGSPNVKSVEEQLSTSPSATNNNTESKPTNLREFKSKLSPVFSNDVLSGNDKNSKDTLKTCNFEDKDYGSNKGSMGVTEDGHTFVTADMLQNSDKTSTKFTHDAERATFCTADLVQNSDRTFVTPTKLNRDADLVSFCTADLVQHSDKTFVTPTRLTRDADVATFCTATMLQNSERTPTMFTNTEVASANLHELCYDEDKTHSNCSSIDAEVRTGKTDVSANVQHFGDNTESNELTTTVCQHSLFSIDESTLNRNSNFLCFCKQSSSDHEGLLDPKKCECPEEENIARPNSENVEKGQHNASTITNKEGAGPILFDHKGHTISGKKSPKYIETDTTGSMYPIYDENTGKIDEVNFTPAKNSEGSFQVKLGLSSDSLYKEEKSKNDTSVVKKANNCATVLQGSAPTMEGPSEEDDTCTNKPSVSMSTMTVPSQPSKGTTMEGLINDKNIVNEVSLKSHDTSDSLRVKMQSDLNKVQAEYDTTSGFADDQNLTTTKTAHTAHKLSPDCDSASMEAIVNDCNVVDEVSFKASETSCQQLSVNMVSNINKPTKQSITPQGFVPKHLDVVREDTREQETSQDTHTKGSVASLEGKKVSMEAIYNEKIYADEVAFQSEDRSDGLVQVSLMSEIEKKKNNGAGNESEEGTTAVDSKGSGPDQTLDENSSDTKTNFCCFAPAPGMKKPENSVSKDNGAKDIDCVNDTMLQKHDSKGQSIKQDSVGTELKLSLESEKPNSVGGTEFFFNKQDAVEEISFDSAKESGGQLQVNLYLDVNKTDVDSSKEFITISDVSLTDGNLVTDSDKAGKQVDVILGPSSTCNSPSQYTDKEKKSVSIVQLSPDEDELPTSIEAICNTDNQLEEITFNTASTAKNVQVHMSAEIDRLRTAKEIKGLRNFFFGCEPRQSEAITYEKAESSKIEDKKYTEETSIETSKDVQVDDYSEVSSFSDIDGSKLDKERIAPEILQIPKSSKFITPTENPASSHGSDSLQMMQGSILNANRLQSKGSKASSISVDKTLEDQTLDETANKSFFTNTDDPTTAKSYTTTQMGSSVEAIFNTQERVDEVSFYPSYATGTAADRIHMSLMTDVSYQLNSDSTGKENVKNTNLGIADGSFTTTDMLDNDATESSELLKSTKLQSKSLHSLVNLTQTISDENSLEAAYNPELRNIDEVSFPSDDSGRVCLHLSSDVNKDRQSQDVITTPKSSMQSHIKDSQESFINEAKSNKDNLDKKISVVSQHSMEPENNDDVVSFKPKDSSDSLRWAVGAVINKVFEQTSGIEAANEVLRQRSVQRQTTMQSVYIPEHACSSQLSNDFLANGNLGIQVDNNASKREVIFEPRTDQEVLHMRCTFGHPNDATEQQIMDTLTDQSCMNALNCFSSNAINKSDIGVLHNSDTCKDVSTEFVEKQLSTISPSTEPSTYTTEGHLGSVVVSKEVTNTISLVVHGSLADTSKITNQPSQQEIGFYGDKEDIEELTYYPRLSDANIDKDITVCMNMVTKIDMSPLTLNSEIAHLIESSNTSKLMNLSKPLLSSSTQLQMGSTTYSNKTQTVLESSPSLSPSNLSPNISANNSIFIQATHNTSQHNTTQESLILEDQDVNVSFDISKTNTCKQSESTVERPTEQAINSSNTPDQHKPQDQQCHLCSTIIPYTKERLKSITEDLKIPNKKRVVLLSSGLSDANTRALISLALQARKLYRTGGEQANYIRETLEKTGFVCNVVIGRHFIGYVSGCKSSTIRFDIGEKRYFIFSSRSSVSRSIDLTGTR